jgi:ribosomal protein S18 acetylase RimI-like enzyme
MVIRPIGSPTDLTIARTLFEEYGASLGFDLGFQDFDGELARLPGAYVPPAGALLLADLDGEVVGCVALRPLEPPLVAELKRLYVRAAGRGHGLGSALSLAALDRARAAGYRRVRLDTLPGMTQAQVLYRQLGFREILPYRYNPVPGTMFMELDLNAPVRVTREPDRDRRTH